MAKAVVTKKNENLFVALATLIDQDNLTVGEVETYLRIEQQYAKAKKLADRRKKDMEKRLARIVQVTLGIKDMKEFKLMSPEQVEKLFNKRYEAGEFTMEKAIEFFKKSSRKKLPYKDLLLNAIGQAALTQLQEIAPTGYSYTIRETAETVQ